MVGTPWRCWARWLLAVACAGPVAGCAVVPKSRLDECHQLSRNLQAQNSQLRDKELSLRSQNQDLTQRAVDDARRLTLRDEEVERLTESIHAYQQERDELVAAVDRIRKQFQASGSPLSASQADRFRAFAENRPDCEFDPQTGVSRFAADRLFEAGSDRLKPEALALLRAYASLIGGSETRDIGLLVVGHADDSGVRLAAIQDHRPKGRHLSLDRATRVREVLATEARLDPSRIDVAGYEEARPDSEATRSSGSRIEIHLRRRTPEPGKVTDRSDARTGP